VIRLKLIILIFSLILLSIPFIVYFTYLLAILFYKHRKLDISTKKEKVSIVIPARNEEEIIYERIKNIAELNYPIFKINVILIDDNSSDNTVKLAKSAFKKYKIKNKIIRNKKRMGTNYNYNLGVREAKTEFVVTTDADAFFDKDSISYLFMALQNPEIGAACGELKPIINKKCISTSTETPYRDVYGRMCSWESKIGSSFCFNGPLIMLRKSAFTGIPDKSGASDASAALNILQNKFKTIYVPEAKFSELIATDIKSQRRQKVRRASRLLEAIWNNKNLMFNRSKFGNIIFPLRFVMFFIAPSALFLGVISFILAATMFSFYFGLISFLIAFFVLFLGQIKPNFLSSLVWHNFYLFEGLFRLYKGNHLWRSIGRK